MDRLNFNHLYYFYVVAKEGSIKAASETLHVSQPTISDQIRLLEEHMDVKLFERRSRSLFLTTQGELAVQMAQKIFDMGNELTSRLRNKITTEKKTLDIGITHYMSAYFLYDTILPLFDQIEISINTRENQRHILLAELEKGNIDIMFTDTKEGISTNMSAHRVGTNKTYIVAHKKFRKLKKPFPDSLNDIPFFNYTNDSFLKYEIDLFFSKNGIAPQVIGEADDIDLLELVTKKGLAFTIVPEAAKKRFCLNNDVISLGEIEDLQTSVWAIVKRNYKGLGRSLLTKK